MFRTVDVLALVTTVAVCGIGPLALAVVLARRMQLPRRIVGVAAGCYLLNLALQQPIFAGLRPVVAGLDPVLLAAVIPSAVFAVTEEVVRYLSWHGGAAMRRNRTSDGAVVAGLAWGGAESAGFTLMLLVGVVGALLAPGLLHGAPPPVALAAASLGSLAVFVPGRLCALAGHVAFAHLSVQAYRRSLAYLPVVIAAHFAFDASVFTLAAVLGPRSLWPSVLFAALAVVAVGLVLRLRGQWAAEGRHAPSDEASVVAP